MKMNKNNLKENVQRSKGNIPLYVYSYNLKDYKLYTHWHDEIEFIFVEEGELDVTIDMKVHKLKVGDLAIINNGQIHSGESKSGINLKHHAVLVNYEFLKGDSIDYCFTKYISKLMKGKLFVKNFIYSNDKCKELIIKELKNIIDAKNRGDIAWELSVKASFYNIFAMLFREEMIEQREKNDDTQIIRIQRVKKVLEYIKENYSERIYIRELAELISMNEQYFCRFFKEITGHTPVEFINIYRVDKAEELLIQENLSVSETALAVGYDNISYFIRKFKHYKGSTPKKYRKNGNLEG